jgi:hypothetical protein
MKMAKLYVIVDIKMNTDTFIFMQQHDGAAASYFYNWSLMQNHRDFALYSIAGIGYSDSGYSVIDIDRSHICNMPSEEEENAYRKA